MPDGFLGLLEMGLVFGAVLVFGFWQFRSLRKYKEADAKTKAERAKSREASATEGDADPR